MRIQVVVEPTGAGFVARAGAPFGWTAEGATADEAVAKLRQRAAAASVVTLDVPDGANPWAVLGGSAKDVDPELWQDYLDAIAENRRLADEEERRADEEERRANRAAASPPEAVGS